MSHLQDIQCQDWNDIFPTTIQTQAINSIENGAILHLPKLSFTLTENEKKFLSADIANSKAKNISLNPTTRLVSGLKSLVYREELTLMMQRYTEYATRLIKNLFPHYENYLMIGRTSFRPAEISGRATSYRKDDTRLHVDAFPATPNQGRRILRIFTNINPDGKSRVWRVGDAFPNVAKQFLPQVHKPWGGKAKLLKLLRITKSYRTEYDHIMLKIHDAMKADLKYQAVVPQHEIHFLPGSSWIVQTDHVSHAAMSGQYVLEQTFYLPVMNMADPYLSPLKTLEKMVGKTLS